VRAKAALALLTYDALLTERLLRCLGGIPAADD
jgi:hypothetical protein